MRINRYIALATGLSRRAADKLADSGEIFVNGHRIKAGYEVADADKITLKGKQLRIPAKFQTIMLNKPAGYVCSRTGQGSKTIYDLLPEQFHILKPVGRLDKDSSGLILLTNDGKLANKLTHPRYNKIKNYELSLDKVLKPHDWDQITKRGVILEDGKSQFTLRMGIKRDGKHWSASLREGRNRQIRRTFDLLGYKVVLLHRTSFGNYQLKNLKDGNFKLV